MTDTDPRNTDRDGRILAAAAALAARYGYRNVTRAAVADAANVSPTSVSNYGRTRITNGDHPPRRRGVMADIQDAVMRHAVATGNLVLLRQGLADQHPVAIDAPEQLRVAALTATVGA